jgi:GGDEF domain-containing protein
LFDASAGTRTVYRSVFSNEGDGDVIRGAEVYFSRHRHRMIHPDDVARFKALMDEESLLKRLRESKRGSFSEFVQMKLPNGSGAYTWAELLFVSLPDRELGFLMCIKPAPFENLNCKSNALPVQAVSGEEPLDWRRSFLTISNLKLFWKDKNRRFLGASQAFLDYYGFESVNEILGKTDEDIGWHVNDSFFASDEKKVLEKGECICDAPGKNVVNGVVCDILANKFPLYRGREIVGLIGYFVDVHADLKLKSDSSESLLDPDTGLMNSSGMMASLMELDNNFRTNGEDYMNIRLSVHGYKEFLATEGKNAAQALLRLSASLLKKYFGNYAILSRSSGGNFNIAIRRAELDKVLETLNQFAQEIKNVTEVDGKSCALHASFGYALGKDGDSVLNVLEICIRRQKLLQKMAGKMDDAQEALVDPYADIPLPYVIAKPILDEATGEVVDEKFIFVNQLFCRLTGLSREELIGHNYLEITSKTDRSWVDVAYRASKGELLKGKLYDGVTHQWLRYTASPAAVPGTCCIVSEIVDA